MIPILVALTFICENRAYQFPMKIDLRLGTEGENTTLVLPLFDLVIPKNFPINCLEEKHAMVVKIL